MSVMSEGVELAIRSTAAGSREPSSALTGP